MRASVRDEELMRMIEEMYAQDKSTAEIGHELGLTKNQVVSCINTGRKYGYEFPKRPANFWQTRVKKGKTLTELQKYKLRQAGAVAARVKAAQYRSVAKQTSVELALKSLYVTEDIVKIPPEGLPLLYVPSNGCRFPIGDRDGVFLFCSQPRAEGSYCQKHLRIMWPNRFR